MKERRGEGAQILAGREASGGEWRRVEASEGGESAGLEVDNRGSCGNISQTVGGRGLTTAEP